MGLADRYYMREGSRRGPLSVSVILMITLAVIFAVQCILEVYATVWLEKWLALTRDWILRGRVWQLITFQFLHGDILHLLFNVLTVWFFGRFVESVLGRNRFVVAYLACGVAGGILQGTLMVLWPGFFGTHLFGASAGAVGLFAIFATILPTSEIRLFFVLPIQARILLWISLGIAAFFTLVPSGRAGEVAHAAHLGGLLMGIAWVKLGWHRDFVQLPWEGWLSGRKLFKSRDRKRELVKTASKSAHWPTSKSSEPVDVPEEEFISREVDPILDKISAHGIQSLTDRERKILEKARAKMGKR